MDPPGSMACGRLATCPLGIVRSWGVPLVYTHFSMMGCPPPLLTHIETQLIDGEALLECTLDELTALGLPIGVCEKHFRWLSLAKIQDDEIVSRVQHNKQEDVMRERESAPRAARILFEQMLAPIFRDSSHDGRDLDFLRGVAFLACKFLDEPGEDELFSIIQSFATESREKKTRVKCLDFVTLWVKLGRRLSPLLLARMRAWLDSLEATPDRMVCLQAVLQECDSEPGEGRFASISPAANVLAWLKWDLEVVARSINSLSEAFFRVRGHEIDMCSPGKNIRELQNQSRIMSKFVVTTILTSVLVSLSAGLKCLEQWLDVCECLRQMLNFQMLLAIHVGLGSHDLVRLNGLWTRISSKHRKIKAHLDELFSMENRMENLHAEQSKWIGVAPMVPAVITLMHQVLLLRDQTMTFSDGSLNRQYFVAASNIFVRLEGYQQLRPAKQDPKETESRNYFLQLPHVPLPGEEELAELSDQALEKLSGSKLFVRKSVGKILSLGSVGSSAQVRPIDSRKISGERPKSAVDQKMLPKSPRKSPRSLFDRSSSVPAFSSGDPDDIYMSDERGLTL